MKWFWYKTKPKSVAPILHSNTRIFFVFDKRKYESSERFVGGDNSLGLTSIIYRMCASDAFTIFVFKLGRRFCDAQAGRYVPWFTDLGYHHTTYTTSRFRLLMLFFVCVCMFCHSLCATGGINNVNKWFEQASLNGWDAHTWYAWTRMGINIDLNGEKMWQTGKSAFWRCRRATQSGQWLVCLNADAKRWCLGMRFVRCWHLGLVLLFDKHCGSW